MRSYWQGRIHADAGLISAMGYMHTSGCLAGMVQTSSSGADGLVQPSITPAILSQLAQCSTSGGAVPARGTTVLCVRKDDQVNGIVMR